MYRPDPYSDGDDDAIRPTPLVHDGWGGLGLPVLALLQGLPGRRADSADLSKYTHTQPVLPLNAVAA